MQERYNTIAVPQMMAKFGYKNKLQVPRIRKVVVNVGVGRIAKDEKLAEHIAHDLEMITGQKTEKRPAKISIAGFKLREGTTVGMRVTLRRKRMYDFLSRLVDIAIPRSKDFRGLERKSIDKGGNLTIPVKEQIVFPEVVAENVKSIFSFEVTVVIHANSYEEALEFYTLMGFPLKK